MPLPSLEANINNINELSALLWYLGIPLRRTWYASSSPFVREAPAHYPAVLDTTDTTNGPGFSYPFLFNSNIQLSSTQYTVPDGPTLYLRLASASSLPHIPFANYSPRATVGSPSLLIDLLPASTKFVGSIPTANNSPQPAKQHSHRARACSADVKTLGNVYNETLLPRDALVGLPFSDFAVAFNGSFVAGGKVRMAETGVYYRLLLR